MINSTLNALNPKPGTALPKPSSLLRANGSTAPSGREANTRSFSVSLSTEAPRTA